MKKANPFYLTKAWERVRLQRLAMDNFLCQTCLKKNRIAAAKIVHHIKPLDKYPELALTIDNLTSLCYTCHEHEHLDRRKKKGKNNKIKKRKARVIVSKANEPII